MDPSRNDLGIYGRTAPWWDRSDPLFRQLAALVPARLAYLDAQVGPLTGLEVLDLGCGGGLVAVPLARQGARVTGVDVAAGALEAARAQADAEGLALTLVQAPAQAVPLPDASVDVVICTDVLAHVDGPGRVVAEAGRLLRPGGVLYWSSLQRGWLAGFVAVTLGEDWLGLVHRGTHDPARFVDPSALADWLSAAGLAPRSRQGLGPIGWRDGALRFGRWPSTAVMAQGHAVRVGPPG